MESISLTVYQLGYVNCNFFASFVVNLNLVHVYSGMSCEIPLSFVSFAALVALERFLPGVRCHVALQTTRRSAIVVTLVTLVWLFFCMLPHHVSF